MVPEGVAGVGQAQGTHLEGIPAPRDTVGIEVPHERRLVVHRREVVRQVIAAARGAAGNRVEAVGPGRAGNRAEPVIANGELSGEVIVDRDVGGVVIARYVARIPVHNPTAGQCLGEARDEPVHFTAADLQVDRARGMIGVIGDRRGLEMVDRVAAPVVVVSELFPQAVDVVAPTLERQISEHVIKRAVLEQQDNDVVDLPEIGQADVVRHHHTPRRGLRSTYPGRGRRISRRSRWGSRRVGVKRSSHQRGTPCDARSAQSR